MGSRAPSKVGVVFLCLGVLEQVVGLLFVFSVVLMEKEVSIFDLVRGHFRRDSCCFVPIVSVKGRLL